MSEKPKPMNPAMAYHFLSPPEQWTMLEELVSDADTDKDAREALVRIARSYLERTNRLLRPPDPPPTTLEELKAMGGSWGYGFLMLTDERLPAPLAKWIAGVLEKLEREVPNGET